MQVGLAEQIRETGPLLAHVSAERKRDEIFKILEGFHPASAIRLLDHTGLLGQLFPDLSKQKGITQSPPHDLDVWEHTLATVAQMSNLLDLFLDPEDILADGGNLMLGLAAGKLGRFQRGNKGSLSVQFKSVPVAARHKSAGSPVTRCSQTGNPNTGI